MSDFYSVLKQSIVDRGLRSPSARQEVYAQARAAMIRQLWSYDPPLAEHEIDARIGAFDRTVERIEDDLAGSFAKSGATRPAAAARREPKRSTVIFEGYDQDADYAPAMGGHPARDIRRDDDEGVRAGGSRTEEQESAETVRFARRLARDPLAEQSAAIEHALRTDEDRRAVEREEYEDDEGDETRDEVDRPREDEFAEDEGADEEYRADDRATARGDYSDQDEADTEPARRKSYPWTQLSHRSRVRFLIGAIAALGIILIVIGTVIALSLFSGPDAGGGQAGPVAPQVPAGGQASAGAATVVQSFSVFDGGDPTVFESASGNPVRLDKDGAGRYARITSSTSDAGVRVVLGPGLANRLAGQPVRVTLVSRSAHENGAANLRFAYQSGVALSHWQAVNLTPEYSASSLVWRVPKMRTDPSGDYLLIEPGIPGDGTAAEIQSIKIDLLSSEPS
jgi:hypothetical protein